VLYRGSCHCKALQFELDSEPITTGISCNCSICSRRGLVMSSRYYPRAAFHRLDGLDALALYMFGDRMVHHYFCRTCGVYPLSDATTAPGEYRVNLGCVDELDPSTLAITHIDGKSY
jgi:hypothetical protein